MNQLTTNMVREILSSYGLVAEAVSSPGRVVKLTTNRGSFALKKSRLNDTDFANYYTVLQTLSKKGCRNCLPPVPTKAGNAGVRYNNSFYTLTPWLNDQQNDVREKELLKELAKLHRTTVKEINLQTEQLTSFYQAVTLRIKKQRSFFEKQLYRCEQHTYLSPAEFLFTRYFFQSMMILNESERRLTAWQEEAKEKKARTVICLHNAKRAHLLTDDEGRHYFINLERAGYNSPVFDLLIHSSIEGLSEHEDAKSYAESLEAYFDIFSWHREEKLLFAALLGLPDEPYEVLKAASKQTRSFTSLSLVRELQQAYWKMDKKEKLVNAVMQMD